jgi:hypothetical protein
MNLTLRRTSVKHNLRAVDRFGLHAFMFPLQAERSSDNL